MQLIIIRSCLDMLLVFFCYSPNLWEYHEILDVFGNEELIRKKIVEEVNLFCFYDIKQNS
jgi:hypothetical protein